jgi:PST family polysaccharide transporter
MSNQDSGRRFAFAMTLGSIQTGVVLLTSLVSVKLTSIYIGPAGLAMVAQMQGLLQIFSGVIGMTVGTAMVRLGSQYGVGERFATLANTGLRVALAAGLFIILFSTLFSTSIWSALFGDSSVFAPAIFAIGVGALTGMFQSVIVGAMNGANETALVSGSRVLAACVGLIGFSIPMILWGINGALLGVGVGAVLQCAAVFLLMSSRSGVRRHLFAGHWSNAEFKAISNFLPMMIALTVADPSAMILMRKYVLTNASADAAGILQASYRLAEVSMTVLTAGVSLYSLPRLGALTGNLPALREEVRRIVFNVASMAVVLGIIVFALRKIIVVLVFNKDFGQVAELMSLQMIWLPLKSTAWACGLILVSQMRHKSYIAAQFVGPIIFIAIVMQIEFPGSIARVIVASCIATGIQLLVAMYAIRDFMLPASNRIDVK